MNKYSKILAKSNPEITLEQHIKDCLSVFPKVLQWKGRLIDLMAQKYNIDKDLLISRLFLTVAFHDIAKATSAFQAKVRGKENNQQESHALSSIAFLYLVIKDVPISKFKEEPYYPELMSIATHHSRFYQNSFDSIKLKNDYADEDYFIKYYEMVNEQAELYNIPRWNIIKFDSNVFNEDPRCILRYNIISKLKNNDYKYDKSNKARDLFLLFKSVLHYCDWIASSGNFGYQYNNGVDNNIITRKMIDANKGFKSWNDFQIKSANAYNRNIFVQISTGQGKTEAATLWATNENDNQKIIFLLPTMVTTNKMYKRMLDFFESREIVGLSHSAAQYYLKDDDQIAENDIRKQLLYNRTFFKPVTVATVDQLIYSFFNWGHWVMTSSASYNARIIIDEIHIYDAYTFGLLLQTIECIKPFNTQFAIMSASLPNVLKSELEKVLPDYVLIQEPAHDEKQRHIIEVQDSLIEENIYAIKEHFFKGKKVLIVCNTIAKAREVFNSLDDISSKNKMLYHSQFILSDKRNKETILEGISDFDDGFIAICTQIVEVSLDIDFDVLFTENAPIDAIIQRLGRVNRKGRINERVLEWNFSPVIITRESENSRKYVYKNLEKILSNTYSEISNRVNFTNGNLKEKDFRELVNTIYTVETLGSKYFEEIESAKKITREIWRIVLKNVFTLNIEEARLNEISSRKSEYITVEAVVLKHFHDNNLNDVANKNRFDLIREHTIKVPIHVAKRYKQTIITDTNTYVIDLGYDEIVGLHLKSDDSNII